MKANLCLLFAFALSACATTHPGKIGEVVSGPKQPLVISAERQSHFSDEHYTFVTFTVENKSDDMARIKSSDLDFDDAAELKGSVIVGKDLVAWGEANEEEMKKSRHNRDLAQLGIILGGLALEMVGNTQHNRGLTAAGDVAMIGGTGWTLGTSISQAIERAHNPRLVPDEHIYSQFSVPAGKYVRKWAVIQHAKGAKIQKVYLTLGLEDGSETKYALDIK
jgi:hypothetical protein